MKKLILALVAASVFAFSSCAKKTVVLKLSDVLPDDYPTTLADNEFKRLVEERTKGRVVIEVHTGGSLFSDESSEIEALKSGELAFARTSCSPLAAYVTSLSAIQLPYLYKNSEHMWKVLNGHIGQTILSEIERSDSGLVGLCYYDGGARSFYLTKEVHSPKDMAGLKIRVQNNAMMMRLCRMLGARGFSGIAPSEIRSAIQQGRIDGAENSIPIYQSMGDYKAAKYYIMDEHTRFPEVILASAVAMNSLSSEDRKIIFECAKETQEFEIKKWKEKEVESEKLIREAGNVIIQLTEEEKDEFRTLMKPLYEDYAKGYEAIVEEILGM